MLTKHSVVNKLYIYSLGQTAMGHYVLNLVSSSDVPHSKVVIHALPSFLANLWIVRVSVLADPCNVLLNSDMCYNYCRIFSMT